MGQLAINGGAPSVTLAQDGAVAWPHIGPEELAATARVLLEPNYSFYEEAYRLEEELAAYVGGKYALAHTNGTAAIHAALFALNIQPGDEVLVPSHTYWASCLPVAAAVNGVPVFVDIDPDSLNIDPADIEQKITPRTRAIMVVHLGGVPCEMDRIMEIARRHGLKVIEDASHAHGAEYHGKKIGVIGDIACFSLQASKLLPGIEGGILVTNEREYYERAVALGHYERVRNLPQDSPYRQYEVTGLGFKYRIHPAAAAVTRSLLARFDSMNEARNQLMGYLDERLAEVPGFAPMAVPSNSKRVYYTYRVHFKSEELGGIGLGQIIAALQAEGVMAAPERYAPQHVQPAYRDEIRRVYRLVGRDEEWQPPHLPVTESIHERLIGLPTFPQGTPELVEQYARAFQKVAEGWRDIPQVDVNRGPVDGSRSTIR